MLTSNPDRERLMNIDADRLQHLKQELALLESTRTDKESLYKRVKAGDTQLLQSSLLEENLKKEAELDLQLARLSQKFGPNFPQVQREQEELAEVRKTLATERERLFKRVEEEFQTAADQERRIREETEELRKKIAGGPDEMMEYNVLKRDVELNQQAYESLLQKLQEATTRASLKTPTARIVDPAELPAVSSHPELARNFVLGLFAGMILGIGLAFGENHLRDTINTTAEVEADLNLQLLGVVPTVEPLSLAPSPAPKKNYFGLRRLGSDSNGKQRAGNWFRLDRDATNRYVLSEAISNLRASLMFALEDAKPRAVLFSSSLPSEGKTTISSNLSISLTQIGKKVLMIDGDLRRPCLHKVFSVPNRAGLSEYLRGVCEWKDVLQSSSVPGLDLVVCGERPENPAELLSSERMRQIIEQAKLRYDYVVVDSPTLLNMADSRILASYVDNVELIVRSRATPKLLAKRACANVQGAGATIVGVVLNQQEVRDSEYSYSYYGYGQPKEVRSVNSKGEFISH
jgi:capsular exopolysaccharide synthesis family protein